MIYLNEIKRSTNIQGFHKVLLLFKKFITKALDEISYTDLFYIKLVFIEVFIQTKIFCFRCMCLVNVFAKWLLLKRRHNVYSGLLRQNRMFRLSENTELSMEKIYHHVLQFIDGTRNL